MLYKSGKELFNDVFRIMQDSFPENERRTYAEQKELLKNKHYNLYVYKEKENSDIEGFIGFWKLSSFIFIEHIAVDSAKRGQGTGSKMLKEIKAICNEPINNINYNGIVLEVELPDNPEAISRIKFYERHGFFLNKYHYEQPPMKEGMDLLPLYIMSYGRELSEEEFKKVRNILYKDIYHYN